MKALSLVLSLAFAFAPLSFADNKNLNDSEYHRKKQKEYKKENKKHMNRAKGSLAALLGLGVAGAILDKKLYRLESPISAPLRTNKFYKRVNRLRKLQTGSIILMLGVAGYGVVSAVIGSDKGFKSRKHQLEAVKIEIEKDTKSALEEIKATQVEFEASLNGSGESNESKQHQIK